jgi:hypothetical protein
MPYFTIRDRNWFLAISIFVTVIASTLASRYAELVSYNILGGHM